MTDKEQFEAWAESKNYPFNASMDDAFGIWQAARTPAADSSAPLGYISQMDIDDLSAYARIAVLTKAKTESQSIPVYLAAPPADSSAGASGDAQPAAYKYFTYTGQCGWLDVSKQEYDDSLYQKKCEPIVVAVDSSARDAERWQIIQTILPDDELEELAITIASDVGLRRSYKQSATELLDAAIVEQKRRTLKALPPA